MRRTLQGSSHDIGWLQRTEGLPPTEDGTIRFMELLHDIRSVFIANNTFIVRQVDLSIFFFPRRGTPSRLIFLPLFCLQVKLNYTNPFKDLNAYSILGSGISETRKWLV